ncbi:MAG: hypothetical protein ABJE10_00535 [bacterium]
MMKGFVSMLHPTFESLSACADMSEIDAARSRIGRHVSQCSACRAIVDEIRQLGDDVRSVEIERAPLELWTRIVDAAAVVANEGIQPRETPSREAAPWESVPALRPTRHWPVPTRKRTRIALAIATAAAIAAVLAWPRGQSLEASGLSRLTFSPARPSPGGILRVRYQPSAWLKGSPRLVLVGRYSAPAGTNATSWRSRDRAGDSLATLLPVADGSYEARVRLPNDFLALQLSVTDSTGEETDTDNWFPWGVIGGDARGAPSLRAMLAAQETFAETEWGEGSARHNFRIDVPDSLKRYFPSHPAGWAFAHDYGTRKGAFSFLRFFQSAERRYLSLYDQLWPMRSLDGEKLHDMAVFAWRIEEPAQAELWAKRLAREHPEDPRALFDLSSVLHEVELRQPKSLADSIRPWLPLLDSLYRRTPTVPLEYSQTMLLVNRYADSATMALWNERYAKSAGVRLAYLTTSDSGVKALTLREIAMLRSEAGKSCERPNGKFRLYGTTSDEFRLCLIGKSQATRSLAQRALLDGKAREALVLSDSSLSYRKRVNACSAPWSAALRLRARAKLALGDTVGAGQDFVGSPPWNAASDGDFGDSVRVALGSHFDAAHWQVAIDSTRREYQLCDRRNRAANDSVAAIHRARRQP